MIGIAQITRDLSPGNSANETCRLAVEACPNGMLMTDDTGTIVLANAEIERLFGYHRDELIGRPIELLLPERMRDAHAQRRRPYSRRPDIRRLGLGRNLLGRRKDGNEVPVEIGLFPVRNGGDLMVLAVVVDIGERRRMDRLEDEFVSTVSHELRTPLTSIAGSLGLLIGGAAGTLPEPAARLIRIAQSNSQRLVRLINDILDIEKIESGQIPFNFTRLDARSLAEQVIEANRGFADGFRVRIRMKAGASAGEVYADADRLAQVITNLLSNAIKFSPPEAEVEVAIDEHDETVRITVRDHGNGIPKKFRSHIFEKFAQADSADARRKVGTGLGLSIVRQIVTRLGGTVGFDDAIGGGTVFYVDLPGWKQAAARELEGKGDAAPDGDGRPRILHIDDDQDAREIVAETLNPTAHVVSVGSIEETRYMLLIQHFDLAILDIGLGAVSGLDLLPDLRGKDAPIPVIIFSAHSPNLAGNPQIKANLNKSSSASLKDLVGAVHDRMLLRSAPNPADSA
jgi:PAS domain S-box-containing protein